MPKIFEEHEEIVLQSQKEAEDGLKVSTVHVHVHALVHLLQMF